MYSDVFCKVYNEFGWNYYPEIFGEQLLVWLRRNNVTVKTSMDLACGTGVLCEIMYNNGSDAYGMDFSLGMIDIAKSRNSAITYEVADMITYRPNDKFDLVTCTGDALNHIESLSDIKKIFENIYAYTSNGGYFIFDILNENEISDSEPFEMDFDVNTKVWFQMTRPAENKVNLKIRVFENGELSFEENIRETVHDVKIICSLLEDCGFKIISCGDKLLEDAQSGTTWFVIAKKI